MLKGVRVLRCTIERSHGSLDASSRQIEKSVCGSRRTQPQALLCGVRVAARSLSQSIVSAVLTYLEYCVFNGFQFFNYQSLVAAMYWFTGKPWTLKLCFWHGLGSLGLQALDIAGRLHW